MDYGILLCIFLVVVLWQNSILADASQIRSLMFFSVSLTPKNKKKDTRKIQPWDKNVAVEDIESEKRID